MIVVKRQTLSISEVYAGMYDGPHATPKPSDSGPIFLGIKNVGESGQLDLSDVRHISEDEYPRWIKRIEPRYGDIVFSYEATLNRYAMIPKGFRGCLGRRMALIRPDEAKACGKYLYFYFFGQEWRNVIAKNTLIGSTVDRIPIAKFPDFPITIPPLPTQRKIAAILSAYDDLIENNLRRIKILGEMAQNLYREWFVKFRFPGHQHAPFTDSHLGRIPEGWEVRELHEIAEVIDCLHSKKPRHNESGTGILLQLCNIGESGIIDLSELFLITDEDYKKWISRIEVQAGDCVITNVGRVGAVAQIPTGLKAAIGRNMTAVRPFAIGPTYLIEYLHSPHMIKEVQIKKDAGSIMDSLNVKGIVKLLVPVGPHPLMDLFEENTRPMRALIERLFEKNNALQRTRDLLLPRLISGEVDVSELDTAVPEEAGA
jgi:type I restriction enzyme S subunit